MREKVRVGPFPARGGTHHVLAGALTPLTSLRDGRSRSGSDQLSERSQVKIESQTNVYLSNNLAFLYRNIMRGSKIAKLVLVCSDILKIR